MKIYEHDEIEILYLTNKYFNVIQLSIILDGIYPFSLSIHRDEFHYGKFKRICENINRILPPGLMCMVDDLSLHIDKIQ